MSQKITDTLVRSVLIKTTSNAKNRESESEFFQSTEKERRTGLHLRHRLLFLFLQAHKATVVCKSPKA